ncbi:ATP-binding protein [Arthrobacter ruber]|uniref:ATP-binding protein n=1 Tax=Arthrobacter ruber TaxID=1258893 RepID=UPI000CF46700|nr:ATP-binding protein [Arthrobacter ruber]
MRPPLLRRADGVIAGVCAGLAVHLGISRSWVRVGMVILTFASGAGIVLYAWLWIFVPTAADRAAEAGRKSGPAAFMHGVGADPGLLTRSGDRGGNAGHGRAGRCGPGGMHGRGVPSGVSASSGSGASSGIAGSVLPSDSGIRSGIVGSALPSGLHAPSRAAGSGSTGGSSTPDGVAGSSIPGGSGVPDGIMGGSTGTGSAGSTETATHATTTRPAVGLLDPDAWRDRTVSAGRREILFGTAMLLAAAVLVVQLLGVDVNWGFLVPIAVVATGAALAWSQLDEVRRARVMNRAGAGRVGGTLRLLAGLVLVIAGVLVALSSSGSWTLTVATLVAVLAVLAGVGLVLAPWGLKFWRDLETERAGRVRETERAEMAAHLHDSVLQTLALIQNRADSETDVLRLARAQERELRQWLFADPARDPGSLAERLRVMAGEIEDRYGHPVAVVAVGDAVLGPAEDALAQAAREAMVNAAKHAGVAVSVYLEAGPEIVEVFVRDRGPGFDLSAVPADRLGIRESIHSRMARHGGSSDLRSDEDGTEVRLRLPRPVRSDA